MKDQLIDLIERYIEDHALASEFVFVVNLFRYPAKRKYSDPSLLLIYSRHEGIVEVYFRGRETSEWVQLHSLAGFSKKWKPIYLSCKEMR